MSLEAVKVKPRIPVLVALTVALALARPVHAGIRVIEDEPANAVPIRLETGGDAGQTTLFIPKALLERAKPTDPDGKKAQAVVAPSAMLALVGLTCTLSIAGLGFVVRRIGRGGAALLMILALAVILVAGRCSVRADAAPWPHYTPRPPLTPPQLKLPAGNVTVKVVDDGDAVRLVVPKAQLADWAARLKAPEKTAP
jgi:hypothetical protein